MGTFLNFRTDSERAKHLESLIKIPSINPISYDCSRSYERLDFIFHPDFGPGFVEKVIDHHKIKIYFAESSCIVEQNIVDRKAPLYMS